MFWIIFAIWVKFAAGALQTAMVFGFPKVFFVCTKESTQHEVNFSPKIAVAVAFLRKQCLPFEKVFE